MLFSWFRNRRRRKILAEPFPVRWEEIVRRNVSHYPRLTPAEQAKLRDITQVFITEKDWVGCGGLFVNEEMKVTIAALAALLLLGIEHDYYAHVKLVVVYPTAFHTPVADDEWEDDELSDTLASGQAVYRGPVLLAWDEVLPEGRNPDEGFNVVIHEFAHQLDYLDNLVNGTPPLADAALEARWRYVMTVAYEDHRREVNRGADMTFFSEHAADSETEFFADATEAFYCRPSDMKADYPELYQLLEAYYRVDPEKWFSSAASPKQEGGTRVDGSVDLPQSGG
jgi:Mlc titration factor MtfA (ptsG expression regulator)